MCVSLGCHAHYHPQEPDNKIIKAEVIKTHIRTHSPFKNTHLNLNVSGELERDSQSRYQCSVISAALLMLYHVGNIPYTKPNPKPT